MIYKDTLIVWIIATIVGITVYILDLNHWQNVIGGALSLTLCLIVTHVVRRVEEGGLTHRHWEEG